MMKKNLFKKVIGSFLAGTMLATALTGCGNDVVKETETQVVSKETESTVVKESETQVVEEGVTYPLDTDETLTVAIVQDKPISTICKDITETPFWENYQEALGVKLEAIVVENNNAMSLLLAGGDLPDIIWWRPNNYAGGAAQMIADKLLDPLTEEELNKWAPDLAAVLAADEGARRDVTTDDGKIIGFPLIYGDSEDGGYLQTSNGLFARADWLEKLNMEVPKTPDQFLDMLRAFKTEMGAEAPFTTGYSTDMNVFGTLGFVSSAYGLVNTSLYQVDGKVQCGFMDPAYKDVLAFVKTMYDEGLIAKDYMTTDGTVQQANMLDGTSGCTYGAAGSSMGTWLKQMAESDAEYDLVAIPSLTADGTGKAMFGPQSNKVHVFTSFITPQCKNKELAAKVLNYSYSEEGNMLFNFGKEGESYEMVNGYPTYTELVTNNPNGLTMQQALAQNGRAFGTGPYVVRREYWEQYAGLPQQQNAVLTWMDNDGLKYLMPRFSVTSDESSEYSMLKSDIDTYVNEMFNKFVTGEVSLDAFETEYLTTLKTMGVERYLEIVQGALDRYYAR